MHNFSNLIRETKTNCDKNISSMTAMFSRTLKIIITLYLLLFNTISTQLCASKFNCALRSRQNIIISPTFFISIIHLNEGTEPIMCSFNILFYILRKLILSF
ncbi:hypothetical protein PUN28_000120 [Cardiocondyla obscurior]|uniref:Uncharacterized protein n=1 Tax=Cardiocondyla obscurior TaxID=286306 RepID=A0AAW2GYA5_9HYME